MAILTERYHNSRSPMHAAEMRAKLGLGTKLPDNTESLFFTVQGYKVTLLTPRAAAQHAGHTSKPHRIFAQCKVCGMELPFGRLAQHEGSTRCAEAAR